VAGAEGYPGEPGAMGPRGFQVPNPMYILYTVYYIPFTIYSILLAFAIYYNPLLYTKYAIP